MKEHSWFLNELCVATRFHRLENKFRAWIILKRKNAFLRDHAALCRCRILQSEDQGYFRRTLPRKASTLLQENGPHLKVA